VAKKRRRRMPAGLARYWAAHRRGRRNPRRHRNRNRSRAIVYRTRTRNIVRYRNRGRRANRHHHRRRHNPGFAGMSMSELVWMGGGALVNGIVCRAVPQMVPFLSQYNTGIAGYGLNIVTGALGAWGIGKVNRRAGQGAWIGLVVAVGQRIIADNFGSGSAGESGGMSGDLDFDLGYYVNEGFPFAQGSGAGPYARFPGTPRTGTPAFPPTSASAVRAGQAAAAAALPAAAAAPAVAAANTQASQMDRWSGNWS